MVPARFGRAYDNTIGMSSLMLREFFALGVTSGAYVDTLAKLTYRICTFDSHRMGEVAAAAVALNLKARLVYDNYNSWNMSLRSKHILYKIP